MKAGAFRVEVGRFEILRLPRLIKPKRACTCIEIMSACALMQAGAP